MVVVTGCMIGSYLVTDHNQSINQLEICRQPLYDTSRSANGSKL